MKRYMIPATEVVVVNTKLCQGVPSPHSGYGDPDAPQFAPRRGENIIG